MASKVKTVEDFRRAHDKSFIVPERIRAGITALGAQGWEYWGDFLTANKISVTDGSRFAEQFADFIIELPPKAKRVICGSKALANKLREMV